MTSTCGALSLKKIPYLLSEDEIKCRVDRMLVEINTIDI